MNDYFIGLLQLTIKELKAFRRKTKKIEKTKEVQYFYYDVVLKNGMVIHFFSFCNGKQGFYFHHINDLSSYAIDELIELEYIPEKYQKKEFLEVVSTDFLHH